ncbi:MAG: hypothetical protein J5883_01685 [Clostridiales bacterium]|nr:hypothetical protein [Clostridiales bacterium]
MEKYIVSGEFTSSSLNVQGYSLVQIGKGTVKSEKFKERSEVNFDPERLLDALQNKGKVYAYKKKGIVKSLYVVRRTENRYSCNEIFYAPDIMDEPVKDLMDAQVAFLISHNSLSLSKDARAIFKNSVLPELKTKKKGFNWMMFFMFSALYGVMFSQAVGSPAGYIIGIMMGISMGLCLQDTTYHYDIGEAPLSADLNEA